jgi:hypothetical protein
MLGGSIFNRDRKPIRFRENREGIAIACRSPMASDAIEIRRLILEVRAARLRLSRELECLRARQSTLQFHTALTRYAGAVVLYRQTQRQLRLRQTKPEKDPID